MRDSRRLLAAKLPVLKINVVHDFTNCVQSGIAEPNPFEQHLEGAHVAQRAFSEALGTAFLLAAVVGSGIMAARLAGGNGAIALLCNTLPTGTILTVLILMFGPLSGAHFNPAVSLAFAIRGEVG
jgi:Major intrinsic protein